MVELHSDHTCLSVRIDDHSFGFAPNPDGKALVFTCPVCSTKSVNVLHTLPDKSKWQRLEMIRKIQPAAMGSFSIASRPSLTYERAVNWCVVIKHADSIRIEKSEAFVQLEEYKKRSASYYLDILLCMFVSVFKKLTFDH